MLIYVNFADSKFTVWKFNDALFNPFLVYEIMHAQGIILTYIELFNIGQYNKVFSKRDKQFFNHSTGF